MGLLLFTPLPPGLWHDDGVYLLLGRALAEGEGLRYLGVPGDPPAAKFPPLYPALLGLLWLTTDNPYGVAQVATLLNVALLAVTAGLLARWGVTLGLPLRASLGVVAALALSVELWEPALVALSEPLFLAVMAGTLLAAAHAEREGGPGRALLLAGLLLVLVHVRSAGVALLGGALVGLAVRRRWREAGLVLGVCALGMLPWSIWSRRATGALPLPLRDILGGYGGWLTEQIARDPAAYLVFLARSALQDCRLLLSMLVPGAEGLALTLLGALAALPLLGGQVPLARRSPAAVGALVLLLAEIWVWPFQATRLLLPALPLAAMAMALAFHALWARDTLPPGLRRGAALVGAAAAVAFAVASAARLAGGETTARYLVRTRMLANTTALVERLTPPDAAVAAPEFWSTIVLLTGRRSAPSAPFRPDPSGRLSAAGPPAEQIAVWEASGVGYLLLENGASLHKDALELIETRCPGSVRGMGQAGNQILLRLEDDGGCRRALAGG